MKISQLQEDLKNREAISTVTRCAQLCPKVASLGEQTKKIMRFARRFSKSGDRELDVHEQYALARILFSVESPAENEADLIELLRHEIWNDRYQEKSDDYCRDMYEAYKILKTNGLLKKFYIDALTNDEKCLQLAHLFVKLDRELKINKPVMAFLKNYPSGYVAACATILELHANEIYCEELLEYILDLKQDHDQTKETCAVLKEFNEMAILFDDKELPNPRILNLLKRHNTQSDKLVEAFKILKQAQRLDDIAVNYFFLFTNLNPVILARNYIKQVHPHQTEQKSTSGFFKPAETSEKREDPNVMPSVNILQCG